jgi:hypothetical protein
VLCSQVAEVQLAALDCLAALVSGNETVGAALIATSYMGKSLVSQVREASVCPFPHNKQVLRIRIRDPMHF